MKRSVFSLACGVLAAAVLAGCSSGEGDPMNSGPRCGDGVVDTAAGELCDDGNLASGDGCGPRCLFEQAVCGNNRVDDGETCDDGNSAPGDGCSAVCLRESALCGNGVKDGAEDCDDGNMSQTDECLNTCRNPRCGDGNVRAGMEECDSGQANSNTAANACRMDCKAARCGDGVKDTGSPLNETCDDGNNMSGDGCSMTCVREPRCGDGVMDMGPPLNETCDDGNRVGGDGCSMSCTREPRCGDGMIDGGEQCDDSNTAAGDGCSMTCQFEPGHFWEREANDSAATANVLSPIDLKVHGALVASDHDWFQFVLTNPGDVSVMVTADFTTCGTSNIDTLVELHKAGATAGTTVKIEENDDRSGSQYCSTIDPVSDEGARGLAAGTYWVHVRAYGTGAIPDYRVVVKQESICGNRMLEGSETCDDGALAPGDGCNAACQVEPVCGNRLIEGPEECDDGNTASGDRCSSLCVLDLVTEVESNDLPAMGQNLGAVGPGLLVRGAINPANDPDFYKFTLSAAADVKIQTFGERAPVACATPLDLDLQLRGTDGATVLVDRTYGTIGNCATIDSGYDQKARRLAAGTYTVRVTGPTNMTFSQYFLKISTSAVCGDGTRGPNEECDDRNTAGGDGCNASCGLELTSIPEVEANNTYMTATPLMALNKLARGTIETANAYDYYSFTLAKPTDVTIETFDSDAARLTCAMTDTTVDLYDTSGTSVLESDYNTGIDNCSLMTAETHGGVAFLPAGTYFVRVTASLASTNYQLMIRATATCGNGVAENREMCDDGNANDTDGCTTGCQVGAGLAEVEPNDDGMVGQTGIGDDGDDFSIATAQGPFTASTLVRGAIMPAGDEDVFAIRNTTAAPKSVDVWTFETFGRCPMVDTAVHIRNAAGRSLVSNDEYAGTSCSRVTYTIPPMTTVYAHVMAYGDDLAYPNYQLSVVFH